jgi:polyhydroxybutyrate depolymerase
MFAIVATLLVAPPPAVLPAGRHVRSIVVDERKRTYRLYIPENLDRSQPAPLVLALHGAGMTSAMMEGFCGLSKKADSAGFIVVYPDGTPTSGVQTWNAGGLRAQLARGKPDDVKFLAALIDELDALLNIDSTRVYATGMSNGGMMCYKLADGLAERITAVAPVAGTMAVPSVKPARAVPLLHIHCTGDSIVPFDKPARSGASRLMAFKSAPESVRLWAEATQCEKEAQVEPLKGVEGVRKHTFAGGKKGGEVILYEIEGGGHVWPGQPFPFGLIRAEKRLDANEVIWDFFQRHRLKKVPE